jgi:hypothetical protein
LASAYSGLADVYSALASPKNLSRSQARAYWRVRDFKVRLAPGGTPNNPQIRHLAESTGER